MRVRVAGYLTVLVFVVGLVSAGVTAAGRQDASASGAGSAMPDGPGKDVVVRVCGVCHQPDRTASLRLTRDGWDELIGEMVKRGAKLTDAEHAQVLDYLSTNFLGEAPHPINLNTAPAIDLEAVIGLGRAEARAFIAWRETSGPCKTIDDLKHVPGVSFAKLDAARDRAGCF
jgi:competence ComEA-like helix-hairpin-helix protein